MSAAPAEDGRRTAKLKLAVGAIGIAVFGLFDGRSARKAG